MGKGRSKAWSDETRAFIGVPVWYVIAHGGTDGMTVKQISQQLMVSRETVGRRIRDLKKRGLVVQKRDRRWVSIARLSAEVLGHSPTAGLATVPSLYTPPQAPREIRDVPEPAPAPTEAAQRHVAALAKRFDVPEWLRDCGELAIGKVSPCDSCSSQTPLRWGVTPVCPKCAKVWKPKEGI